MQTHLGGILNAHFHQIQQLFVLGKWENAAFLALRFEADSLQQLWERIYRTNGTLTAISPGQLDSRIGDIDIAFVSPPIAVVAEQVDPALQQTLRNQQCIVVFQSVAAGKSKVQRAAADVLADGYHAVVAASELHDPHHILGLGIAQLREVAVEIFRGTVTDLDGEGL